MEIKGKVHCFFEQSGTFKNQFIALGIPAQDYDIQNNFGETDNVIDLFGEIESAYRGGQSVFDSITCDDLIMAFFPCIYFECLAMINMNWGSRCYDGLNEYEKTVKIIEREEKRTKFYTLLLQLVAVVMQKKIRLIIENPWSQQHFLKQGNFVKSPDYVDNNRLIRGDYFVKPTAFWYFNCEPTMLLTVQKDKKKKRIIDKKASPVAGICSEERSMISPDYARNFIHDMILGKPQKGTQLNLFE